MVGCHLSGQRCDSRVVLVVTLLPPSSAVVAHEAVDPLVRLAISQWPDDATRAAAPRPKPARPLFERPAPRPRPTRAVPLDLPAGTRFRTVTTAGLVVTVGDTIVITDLLGEVLAELSRPAPGITVTHVLMQNCHRCPETSHGQWLVLNRIR